MFMEGTSQQQIDPVEGTATQADVSVSPVEKTAVEKTDVPAPPANPTPSEWADVRAATEAAIANLAHLGEPAGAHVSAQELPEILASHLQWLDSDPASGKQADLSAAQLEGIDLTGADLRRAILRKTNLAGADLFLTQLQDAVLAQANLARANLLGTQLQRADLREATLDDAAGIELSQLAGANLRGAILPVSISESAAIQCVRQLSQRAAFMLMAILSLCMLACLRVVTATDAQIIKSSSALPLQHAGNALPMVAFFLIAPVLLLGLCIALHLRLFRLWGTIEALPAIFPSGQDLADCGPWMVMALGFGRFEWLRGRRSALSWLESVIAGFLAYWVLPITLLVFWARYLSAQDLHGSILHVLLIVCAE